MKLIIHRDTEKIGGSVVELISSKGSRIIIDAGQPLLDEDGNMLEFDKYKSKPVKELIDLEIIPAVAGLYQETRGQNETDIDGILISHAHKDHYGLARYINKNIKYYLTEPTHKLINMNSLFTESCVQIDNYKYIYSGKPFKIKDFKITSYLMDHSGFDAQSFLIEADGQNLFYTGDFRDHGRKQTLNYLFNNLPNKVDNLIMEGTNLGNQNKTIKTENELESEIEEILSNPGPVLFTSSAQNIDRIVSFYRAAIKTNRILLIDFYTANILKLLNNYSKIPYPSRNFKNIRVYYPKYLTKRIFKENKERLAYKFTSYKMGKQEIIANRNKILILVRNSTVYDLDRIKELKENIFENANFIYSCWPEYLEKGKVNALKDFIEENNMSLHKIHTSGHADIKTLDKVVDEIKPTRLFPIHTLNPEAYNRFNADIQKLENGKLFKL